MIKYNTGSFGFTLLFRLHGSALFKSLTPALLSSVIFIILVYTTDLENDNIFDHPYPMGALISALTFLLAFRANFSYNRYWEAFTYVHQMHSKWLDVGMDIAAFHLQSKKYEKKRPPAFGEHPTLTCLERERERLNEPTLNELEMKIDNIITQQQSQQQDNTDGTNWRPNWPRFRSRMRLWQRINPVQSHDGSDSTNTTGGRTQASSGIITGTEDVHQNVATVRFSLARNEGIAPIPTGSSESQAFDRQPLQEIDLLGTPSDSSSKIESVIKVEPPATAPALLPQEKRRDPYKRLDDLPVPSVTAHKGKSINKVDPTRSNHRAKFLSGVLKGSLLKHHPSPTEKVAAALNASDSTQPLQITSSKNQLKVWEDNQPPLLLQEAAHLLSLMSAVALSTLRNDLEEAESPLIIFTPGAPWPHVDPDSYHADVRKDWAQSSHRSWTVLSYLFGFTRTPAARTLYNAARPFRVIGGVSDAEIEVLQAARGPYAKVALCSMWLQEFCSREHLNGGMGAVGPPIISRLFQFTSDGMLAYNQARKVAYIPFPFPHAQITSVFVFVVVVLMPVLMLSYFSLMSYAFVINLLTVMCFTGLDEVARELESPFQNVPNDIPLNNFQAQYNEGLLQMFAGYHPDSYWEIQQQIKSDDPDGKASYPPTKERLEVTTINEEQENKPTAC